MSRSRTPGWIHRNGLVEHVLIGEADGAVCPQLSCHRCDCQGDSYSDLSGTGTIIGQRCS
ncbi:hypothetical protein DPMN_007135 [Dreissena polymorpha]|uniref:Uncharacterized protein n=1 Tax=Dreissena polymorpha TaxID=45954 RepID=A0A9D4MXX1_DREPO|nr:hypothetical protein DPMN_007135 [Dreissena polymorpha]